jgi:2-keto-3-deoxy-6-phosphogluconate aldolase
VDSADWRRVLKTLVEKLPSHVCIGVGTVMDDTVCCLEEIAALGGKFALSPINPIGLIEECNRLGILAVPSGLSSNELWDLHRKGARMIKLFHAGQVRQPLLSTFDAPPFSVYCACDDVSCGAITYFFFPNFLLGGRSVRGMYR